jgi:SAM-dependent methyltransferase
MKPNEDFNYYRPTIYWNDFDDVTGWLGAKITGQIHGNWRLHVKGRYGAARRALFVHCGNGWVERDFFTDGLIDEVIGTDISPQLIEEARAKALEVGLPGKYLIADTNAFDFTTLDADWVVNHAAFHHITYIDRAVRSMARMLGPNGILISYDYTGPHRNQYSPDNWGAMCAIRAMLPTKFQGDLRYPHLETMIATDPTEAVHSELILDVCARYFEILEIIPLGGAIAYQILYQNRGLFEARDEEEGHKWLRKIMDADEAYTAGDPRRSFFNFFVGRVKADAFSNVAQLEAWTREENERESSASAGQGRYAAAP